MLRIPILPPSRVSLAACLFAAPASRSAWKYIKDGDTEGCCPSLSALQHPVWCTLEWVTVWLPSCMAQEHRRRAVRKAHARPTFSPVALARPLGALTCGHAIYIYARFLDGVVLSPSAARAQEPCQPLPLRSAYWWRPRSAGISARNAARLAGSCTNNGTHADQRGAIQRIASD